MCVKRLFKSMTKPKSSFYSTAWLEEIQDHLLVCLEAMLDEMNDDERKFASLAARERKSTDGYFSQLEEITEAGAVYGSADKALLSIQDELKRRRQEEQKRLMDGFAYVKLKYRKPTHTFKR